ncbi:hypothetical protein Y032_0067g103 [Ancylostoma ceylanicum]|uniref:Uncharacterized protein n=1 Tax=Ancylostoma ceylanicum TaxID=53326 RepID=A0A016TZT4_9BILA|nr:hypothetical protein Y032_0067g103 [Ancylostoma ceylanicum]
MEWRRSIAARRCVYELSVRWRDVCSEMEPLRKIVASGDRMFNDKYDIVDSSYSLIHRGRFGNTGKE